MRWDTRVVRWEELGFDLNYSRWPQGDFVEASASDDRGDSLYLICLRCMVSHLFLLRKKKRWGLGCTESWHEETDRVWNAFAQEYSTSSATEPEPEEATSSNAAQIQQDVSIDVEAEVIPSSSSLWVLASAVLSVCGRGRWDVSVVYVSLAMAGSLSGENEGCRGRAVWDNRFWSSEAGWEHWCLCVLQNNNKDKLAPIQMDSIFYDKKVSTSQSFCSSPPPPPPPNSFGETRQWEIDYILRVLCGTRYRDFEWLFDRLHNKNLGVIIPGLPEKTVKAKYSFDSSFIEKRRRALQAFLNRFVRCGVFRYNLHNSRTCQIQLSYSFNSFSVGDDGTDVQAILGFVIRQIFRRFLRHQKRSGLRRSQRKIRLC